MFGAEAIVEEEYQKKINIHKTRLRPDILVHIPREDSGESDPTKFNFVAIALKRHARPKRSFEDFDSLIELTNVLKYELAVYVNIGRRRLHFQNYQSKAAQFIYEFAVALNENDAVQVVTNAEQCDPPNTHPCHA